MAKGIKTGGRRPGGLNKDVLPLIERAAKLKCDPFDVLIHFVKGDWKTLGYDNECYVRETKDGSGSMVVGYTITPDMRLRAATEACKYIYAQRKAIDLSGAVKLPRPTIIEKLNGDLTILGSTLDDEDEK